MWGALRTLKKKRKRKKKEKQLKSPIRKGAAKKTGIKRAEVKAVSKGWRLRNVKPNGLWMLFVTVKTFEIVSIDGTYKLILKWRMRDGKTPGRGALEPLFEIRLFRLG